MPNANAIGTPVATRAATPSTKKIARFQLPSPRKSGRANQSAAHTTTAMPALAARNFRPGAVAARRRSENTAIRIAPAATADARHVLLMSRPGVRTIASSIAYSIAGWTISRTKAATTSRIAVSILRRSAGVARLMKVVSRMCALRRVASTAPSADSQTNSVEASSSAHTSGR